mmetsp:Transcript_35470/g.99942  ORF Transcript_35470/g.99942 Transcript_35470/m.99942 type:complete len:143 (-) Transcript_35470:381-809(-)
MAAHGECIFCPIVRQEGKGADTTLVAEEGDVVLFGDKYPSCEHHFLCCPRRHIPNVSSLTEEDLPLLRRMVALADTFVLEKLPKVSPPRPILMGFHVPPFGSIDHLHMHVLVGDLSFFAGLKYTGFWFISTGDLIAKLEKED